MKLLTRRRSKFWTTALLTLLLALWVSNFRAPAQDSRSLDTFNQDTFNLRGDYLKFVGDLDSARGTAFLGHGYPPTNLST